MQTEDSDFMDGIIEEVNEK
ncbi:Protein of unknown function [Bacillus mycoides]|nr:Protein of unknown function [Bacillus mycoides]